MAEESPLDLGSAREVFEESQDFTIGIEEEFSILDPETLDLVDRFEDFRRAAEGDPDLDGSLAGELIASEVEVRSGRDRRRTARPRRNRGRRRCPTRRSPAPASRPPGGSGVLRAHGEGRE
ncbi:MAG: hypothetical protein ACKORA_04265, partial [Solirubrobacterales bacterium]